MPFEKVDTSVDFPALERTILKFWDDNGNVNNQDYAFREHLTLESLQLLTPYRSGYYGTLGLNNAAAIGTGPNLTVNGGNFSLGTGVSPTIANLAGTGGAVEGRRVAPV